MAVTDIQTTVSNLTGVSPSANTVEDAQKFVVASIPKELLLFAQKVSSSSTDGSAISFSVNDSITDVQRNGYSCRKISMSDAVWALDSTSLRYATAKHPVFYHKQGAIHFAPVTDGSNAGYVFYVDYSLIDDDCDLRNAVIYRSSAAEFEKLATSKVTDWSDLTLPVAPPAPSFGSDLSISSSSPVAPTITASTVDTSGWTSPSYTKPVLTVTSNPSITDLDISAAIPVSPESPSYNAGAISISSSAPTYTKPVLSLSTLSSISDLSVSAVSPTAPSLSSSSVSFSTSAPSYVKPTLSLTSFPTLTYSYPAAPVAPTIAATTSNLTTWDGSSSGGIVVDSELLSSAPVYLSPVIEARTAFSSYTSGLSELDPGVLSISSVVPVAPSSPSFTTPDISSIFNPSGAKVPTFTPPIMSSPDWSDTNTWISTEEDSEMLSSRVQEIQAKVGEYSAKLQEAQAQFTKENTEYQALLQQSIQEVSVVLQKEQQEYASKLQKFQAEVSKYQADVSKEVQEYSQKVAQYQLELTTSLQAWQKEETDKISRYQSEAQNNLNEFNEDSAEYQATLQIALKNADLSSAGDGLQIQKFSAELNSYQAQVNKVITDNQAQLQEWQQRNNVLVQKYSTDIQNELNSFNKDSAEYQAQLQISIQDAQLDSQDESQELQKYASQLQDYQNQVNKEVQQFTNNFQKNLQVYQAENQSKISEYQSNIQNELNEFNKEQAVFQNELQLDIQTATNQQTKDAQEYSAKLQKYGSEVQSYQQDVNKQVQEYTINEIQKELAIWNTNIQSDLQSYSSNIQNELNEFNKDAQIYQAQIQASIQDAQLESAEEGQKIQKYSAELNQYQQDINKEIQDFVNTLQKESQEYQSKVALYNSNLQKYQSEIGEKTAKVGSATQNAAYYSKEADKYYQWANAEVQVYIQNNSKMINKTIAAQAAQQQRR